MQVAATFNRLGVAASVREISYVDYTASKALKMPELRVTIDMPPWPGVVGRLYADLHESKGLEALRKTALGASSAQRRIAAYEAEIEGITAGIIPLGRFRAAWAERRGAGVHVDRLGIISWNSGH